MTNGQHAYVIASTANAALKVADMIASGELPEMYGNRDKAISAWALQPDPMKSRYHLWRTKIDAEARTTEQLTDGSTIR